MLTFKSRSDLSQLPPTDPAYPIVEDLVTSLIDAYTSPGITYNADDYGYCILIQEGDLEGEIDIPEIGGNLLTAFWEGAFKKDGFYVAIMLANDDWGLTVTFPDAPWVQGELRVLLDEMVAY